MRIFYLNNPQNYHFNNTESRHIHSDAIIFNLHSQQVVSLHTDEYFNKCFAKITNHMSRVFQSKESNPITLKKVVFDNYIFFLCSFSYTDKTNVSLSTHTKQDQPWKIRWPHIFLISHLWSKSWHIAGPSQVLSSHNESKITASKRT